MKEVIFSTKAKKDLKRYLKEPLKIEALYITLNSIARGKILPASYKVHALIGQYKGCLECHVGSDFLLIWMDENVIKVVRVGTHSELFKQQLYICFCQKKY